MDSKTFLPRRLMEIYRENELDRSVVADLVRTIVRSRRGISRNSVCEWISGFLDRKDLPAGRAVIESVIDILCDAGDVGTGLVHGEPVLVAVPVRRLALPDGRIVGLGDHGQTVERGPDELFPNVSGPPTATFVDVLETWRTAAEPHASRFFSADGHFSPADGIPAETAVILSLCGSLDLRSGSWSIGQDNAAFLRDWFGVPSCKEAGDEPAPDPEQLLVISADAGERIVVEAGPGAGKTNTATERVVRLVEEGLAPSRIVLLSFTRIAVTELRERIRNRLSATPGVAMVQIHTFDSYAARIILAAGAKTAGSHEATIQAATRLLRKRDPLVVNLVDPLEHIIIDEAQDLVGSRREFCEALINEVHRTCGITVFGDFAQAIYGYQSPGSENDTLLELVQRLPLFHSMRITRDHRTRTEGLRSLFRSARDFLRDNEPATRDNYFELRDLIEGSSSETGIRDFPGHPSTTRGLILTRYRSSLLEVAAAMRMKGRQFRISLNDRPLRIEPWLGATLGGLDPDTKVTREAFGQIHDGLRTSISRTFDDCWEILQDLDGSGRREIAVGRVAEGLEYPPSDLVSDYEGTSGPLLSTIHGIKGRQSERVLLLLSAERRKEGINWSEEARTLYVAATRASHELRTGWAPAASFHAAGTPERHWRGRRDYREMEIGLEGDLIEWTGFSSSDCFTSAQEVIDSIWRAASSGSTAEAVPFGADQLMIRLTDDEKPIGILGKQFTGVLREIINAPEGSELPVLSGVSVTGATTVVVTGSAARPPSLALMPLLGGFARIPR
ncbi:UvrD-helicase domain-containing protein [Rhizobium ruizarguesonis]|uniref:UvrD-helicase domain-containing protein n=1 Tax=Rhizobium ruizarguesonis TaxID=2081791 RepID=UPI0013EEAB81|nr:UvrD-helicase domain-containing protein [Rhizobium ruizarguesonis]QJS31284.1 UvrD-helicase domain-containing protein [Rhizobium leguminosarum bv. trifolii TA1]UFW98096.1 UvrD-helicase domain-containing protein [Rhizobium ruizarguesonis]